MSDIVEWLSAVNAALGAWLFAIPFVLPDAVPMAYGFAFWNHVLVGGAIVALSGYDWWVADEDRPGNALAGAATAVLGLWSIAVPYVTTIVVDGWLLWNGIIVGAIVAAIGAYNASQALAFQDLTEHAPT